MNPILKAYIPVADMLAATFGEECEARQSLQNLDKVLMGAGLARDRVVSVHIYVSDIKYWDKVDKVYAEFFGNHKPARVVVPTGKMHYGALVEIEAVAEERGLIAD